MDHDGRCAKKRGRSTRQARSGETNAHANTARVSAIVRRILPNMIPVDPTVNSD
jgi:hypothetical protein